MNCHKGRTVFVVTFVLVKALYYCSLHTLAFLGYFCELGTTLVKEREEVVEREREKKRESMLKRM